MIRFHVIIMRFYLSSYKLGNKKEELVRLMGKNRKIGYIPNAGDYTKTDTKKQNKTNKNNIDELKKLGFKVEIFDLKEYFGKTDKLKKKIDTLGGVFVRGGNTFVLRQAMKLSGFDRIFKELLKRDDFVYAGYSAGVCVLAPDFKALKIVDDSSQLPYPGIKRQIWKGLGYFDYIILPHYKSDHPESADIDKEVKNCKKNNIPFKTLRDGEVIIIE